MDKITKTDSEWRQQLSALAYKVTRKSGTEPAFSNDNFPKTAGMFHCIGCDTALFASDSKFDSGTGWPSFYEPLTEQAVTQKSDRKFFMTRTEISCARCDAHLGHVFPDGPEPTGQRYCMNGVALRFVDKPA